MTEQPKFTNSKIGIDAIAFSTSRYFLSLKNLAAHRSVDYRKYSEGIGQLQMSVFPPCEDIVTIAIDAASKVLEKISDPDHIDLLIFATESSFDISKSAGIFVHHFLKLKPNCRVFDIKQACYSTTAALQMAKSFVQCHPGSKVLVIGSDIVRYSPGSSGEPTQGGAAVAMVISETPRIAYIEPFSGVYTTDIADFWRPVAATEAKFDGKLSAQSYLRSLGFCLEEYKKQSHCESNLDSFIDYCCFHAPFNKMAIKAAQQSFRTKDPTDSLIYNALIGNSCSASLYICLISLLDNCAENLSGKRIGMYSYGSGCVAEYFSLIVLDGYRNWLNPIENEEHLEEREEISFEEYEEICSGKKGNKNYKTSGNVALIEIVEGYRKYQAVIE